MKKYVGWVIFLAMLSDVGLLGIMMTHQKRGVSIDQPVQLGWFVCIFAWLILNTI